MNIRKIRNFQIISIIFIFILGTLLHFTYILSGKSNIVSIFSSVNESVWEHLKLLYFPMIITIIIGYFYLGKDVKNFICSKTIGIIISLIFTVTFFYTYTGIIGKNIAIIDIFSFFISAILGEFVSYLLMINNIKCNKFVSIILLIILFVSFVIFTFYPLNIALFKDPITGQYGI